MDLQGLLTAAAALIAGLAGGWFARPKVAADAGKATAEAVKLDWDRFQKEIKRLEDKIAAQDEKLDRQEAEIENLKHDREERSDELIKERKRNKQLVAHVGRLEKRLAAIEALFKLHPIPEAMREALDRLDKD